LSLTSSQIQLTNGTTSLTLASSLITLLGGSGSKITLDASGNVVMAGPSGASLAIGGVSPGVAINGTSSLGTISLTGSGSVSINGSQIITTRQSGPGGTPSGWADSTAESYVSSLYTALKTHGLIN